MATRNTTRARLKRSRKPARRSLAPKILDGINLERRKLQKAAAILKCLEYAAMYEHADDPIDCTDVAAAVRALIDEADDALDTLLLGRAV